MLIMTFREGKPCNTVCSAVHHRVPKITSHVNLMQLSNLVAYTSLYRQTCLHLNGKENYREYPISFSVMFYCGAAAILAKI